MDLGGRVLTSLTSHGLPFTLEQGFSGRAETTGSSGTVISVETVLRRLVTEIARRRCLQRGRAGQAAVGDLELPPCRAALNWGQGCSVPETSHPSPAVSHFTLATCSPGCQRPHPNPPRPCPWESASEEQWWSAEAVSAAVWCSQGHTSARFR